MSRPFVQIEREVHQTLANGDSLCLQRVRYCYSTKAGDYDDGYRFMLRGPDGKLRALRGQTNCQSLRMILHLVNIYMTKFPDEDFRAFDIVPKYTEETSA